MAPVSDRVYFPSLEACLTGEKVILSWKLAATALSDAAGQRLMSSEMTDFFSDEYVEGLVNDPSTVFSPPDDATNKAFETKTAPINVTSASNDRCDIKIVKEDANWLSRNAKINLVAALRLVVIEFQSRPCRHLTGPLSSQDAKNLQEAAGIDSGQGEAFVSEIGAASALDAEEIWSAFGKDDARRLRLFTTYLSERRNFMIAANFAQSLNLHDRLSSFSPVERSAAQNYRLKVPVAARDEMEALLSAYLQAMADCMRQIESGLKSLTDESLLLTDQVELDWFRTGLAEAHHAMCVVFQVVDCFGDNFAPSSAVSQWFSLMDAFGFFDTIQPIDDSINELILPLQTLSSAVSIKMLNPARSLAYLHERDEDPSRADAAYDSFLLSSDVLEQVHKSIINAANSHFDSASPAIFAWAVLLHQLNVSYHGRTEKRDNLLQQNARETFETGEVARQPTVRRNSAGSLFSIESSKFDQFLENTTLSKDIQVVEQLASAVTSQGKVYNVISRMAGAVGSSAQGSMPPLIGPRIWTPFLELLKISYPFVGYQSEPVGSLVSLLSAGRGYWGISSQEDPESELDILASSLYDDQLLEFYFQQAMERSPYEFLPFITLSRALSSATSLSDDRFGLIVNLLRRTPTLTLTLPADFQGYELVQEDENTNAFCLLQDIPLIALSSSWQRRYIEDDAYRIPVGTLGRFVTDSGRVVLMEYPHSTLSLLGRRLEINLAKEGYRCELGMLQPDEVAEAISMLATLIHMEHLKSSPGDTVIHEDSDLILEASKHISGGRDIVTVVCETMDNFMQDELSMGEEVAVVVLNACIQFLHAILPIHPSRVWSYLARSELLNTETRAGKLTTITGPLDLVSERFEFLSSSLLLFSDLVDTAMSSAVQRRVGNNVAKRQRSQSNPWLGTADKVLSRVSLSIAQAAIDVFENTLTWRFDSELCRVSLLHKVVTMLDNMIVYSYSMGDAYSSDTLTDCLRAAASYVIDCFVLPSSGTLRFQPILTCLVDAFTSSDSTIYPTRQVRVDSQVTSVLQFATTLLRVTNLLDQSSTMIESYLFKISTLLARLCAVSDHYRLPALLLLDALVENAGKASNDPPSLLGYLGPQIAKSFLQLLCNLDKPFFLADDVRATWKFFSSNLRNRQQWMSNCLLTGKTPREAMKKDVSDGELSSDSAFATALAILATLKSLDSPEALAVLDFLASAQNYWPWTVFTLQKDTAYLDGLRNYVRGLSPFYQTAKSSVGTASSEARAAAYVAETFAMQLYHSRHLGKADELAKSLSADLDYYLRDGVGVAGYNKSLHTNFAKNFASKYPGCSLDNFKRTLLEPREPGTSYYYDTAQADEMLRFDPGWLGRKDDGFKSEMERANANLALVDAQIALFHAWEFLLLELSTCLPASETINRQMLQVAQQCLNANQETPGPESIFLKLVDARANLALVLIQRLANLSLPVKDVDQLLVTIVGTINGVDEPFAPDSIAYYRTLLKALFITLRAYQMCDGKGASGGVDSQAVTVTQTVLNLLDRVVGRGFRSLVSLIHDDEAYVLPEDLALLTAILQACLSLPNIDQSQTQVMNIMASHDAMHAATSLFSWADKLADQGDPIYGELSVLFLLELSALPLMAEQLAADGVLSNLLSANLTKFMLKANISPHADSPVAQRCYGIWAKGLLPLMLNLLTALGATVAPELAYVLNQFSHLLQLSVDRFEAPGASRTASGPAPHYVTLLATSEVHSLAMLTRVLAALRTNNNRDIPEVEWDAAGLLENVEFWLSSKKLLKERLLPLGQRELEWRGTKRGAIGDGGPDNLLEEKVVAQLEAVKGVLGEDLNAE